MNLMLRRLLADRLRPATLQPAGRRSTRLAVVAASVAYVLIAVWAVAPPSSPSAADRMADYIAANAQTIEVADAPTGPTHHRDAYAATPGIATLAAGGTNHDWAKLVLLFGEWPMIESNVTVILRWMRQENGPDNWWNRNNPLNNGFGSGGGGGTGSYSDLVVAAQKAAENLHRHPGYGQIIAALAAAAPTAVIEEAIWASPWASGHYANGAHRHYTPVPVVAAPGEAW